MIALNVSTGGDMNIILSNIPRDIPDFVSIDYYQETEKSSLVVLEPTFTSFKEATSEQLELPFKVTSKIDTDTLVISIYYSQENAKNFKGYLIDLNTQLMGLGFSNMNQYHVPWQSYGVPMIGSSLFLMFSKNKFLYKPKKDIVNVADQFPEVHSHAPYNPYPNYLNFSGGGVASGFYSSNDNCFLPIEGWRTGHLECEYVEGKTIRRDSLDIEIVNSIFGIELGVKVMSYIGITPIKLIQSFTKIKYFQNMSNSK